MFIPAVTKAFFGLMRLSFDFSDCPWCILVHINRKQQWQLFPDFHMLRGFEGF